MHTVTTCLLFTGAWFFTSGCSKPHHHHEDEPEAGTITAPTDESVVTSIPCPVRDDEDVELPEGACSPGQQSCRLGRECCCGRCAPNVVCECLEGQWGCYYTDFCAFPSCNEGGVGPDGG